MINNELLNKDPYVVSKKSPIIIMDSKSSVCMAKNGNDTKHTRHISIRMQYVRNCEDFNLHKPVWCEVGLKLSDIGTKNGREDSLNPILLYGVVKLDNSHNTCRIGVIGYIRFCRTMFSVRLYWLYLSIQLN